MLQYFENQEKALQASPGWCLVSDASSQGITHSERHSSLGVEYTVLSTYSLHSPMSASQLHPEKRGARFLLSVETLTL
jgi:hypothetical protein